MKINMVLPGIGHSGGVQMAIDYLNYFARHDNDVICYVPFTGAYYGWKRILFPKAMYRIIKSKDLQGKWISHKINIKFVPYINNLYVRDADITIATSWLTSYWVYNLKQEKGAKVYFVQDIQLQYNFYNKFSKKDFIVEEGVYHAIITMAVDFEIEMVLG